MHEIASKTVAADRERLRNLAARYAELANCDEMNRRREIWRRTNRLEERTVPFQIEDHGTFFKDLLPEPSCEGKLERAWERFLVMAIANFELIPDDRVIATYFPINWAIDRPEMLPEYKETHATDVHGGSLGYTTNKPLSDLPNSLHKLRRGEFRVDREDTRQRAEKAKSIFGDLLPVRITNHNACWAGSGMAMQAVNWIGMENLFLLMMDAPQSVHAFFEFVSQERCDFFEWLEKENLLELNNDEFCVGSGSCGYTDELPRRKINPGEGLRCEDLWGFQEAQEAAGISAEMFTEFIFPYQRKVSSRFGLVYYGCCEPVHSIYPVIKGLPNVRKITVSPWCDQESIAGQVGKNVVLSRKPHPMKLCGESFDSADFKAHIQETLMLSRGNFVELIFRDTCTMNGSMKERVKDACGIVRDLIEKT